MPLFNTTTTTDSEGNSVVSVIPEQAPDLEIAVDTPDTAAVYQNEPTPSISGYDIDGSPWMVQAYFSQLLGSGDEPGRLDLDLTATSQQYLAVHDYVIMVTSGLSQSTDPQQITTLTGSALLYPGLTANIGDCFIARIQNARVILFNVTAVEQVSYFDRTANKITYSFLDYFTDDYRDDLANKTAQTRYFDKDRPFEIGVSKKVYSNRQNAGRYLTTLCEYYWDEFYDGESQTFLVPSDDYEKLYDPYVVEFIISIIPRSLYGRLSSVMNFDIPSSQPNHNFGTVWDLMKRVDATRLSFVSQKMKRVHLASFRHRQVFSGILWSHITDAYLASNQPLFSNSDIDNEDDYYVFSEAFYNQDESNYTSLESMVVNGLNGQLYNPETLESLITSMTTLTDIERFYQIPVIIWLLRLSLKGDW